MKVQRGSFDSIRPLEGPRALSLGTFDGVHRGHQAILRELHLVASRADLAGSTVVTFGLHPRGVLSERGAPPSITDLDERIALLSAAGIDDLVVLDFDAQLATVEYDHFVNDLLVRRLNMQHFVLGHDVHFGRERRGNALSVAALAEDVGFNVSQVASVRDAGLAISSTRIRAALQAGELDAAVRWAGHPITFSGVVEEGRKLGRQIGFPTANLPLAPGKVVLASGVYAGWARAGEAGWQAAVVNLGHAPTVSEDGPLRLEAHLLDAELELYAKRLELALGTRLRSERKFGSKEELGRQIADDCAVARRWLADPPLQARPARLADLELDSSAPPA
ncbi:riboflavin biosynthesis protein RibF [bacterium]|nr:MAG: riboflavin biosynthesis protein RibF [bacterium]